VIRWLIVRVMVLVVPLRFDPGKADGVDAEIELRVGIRGRRACLTLQIADRSCAVRPGPAPDSGAAATVGLADLIRLVIGDVGWPQLLSRGRFQLSGDPFLALRLPTLFRLPATGRRTRVSAAGAIGFPRR
jgi:hypothetical protein